MKQLDDSFGCFPHAFTNDMVKLCQWRQKMAPEMSGDLVETLGWILRSSDDIPCMFIASSQSSRSNSISILGFIFIQLYRHSVRFIFSVLLRILLSRSAGRYCPQCSTEETKIYSGRIIETKQSTKLVRYFGYAYAIRNYFMNLKILRLFTILFRIEVKFCILKCLSVLTCSTRFVKVFQGSFFCQQSRATTRMHK